MGLSERTVIECRLQCGAVSYTFVKTVLLLDLGRLILSSFPRCLVLLLEGVALDPQIRA